MPDQPESQPTASSLGGLSGQVGKYKVIEPLGKGAMGMVYLARDTMLERDVALKVMVAGIAADPELKARFEREARAVAKMTHPNVVMVFDLGYHEGQPYIAMELLKGDDLQKAMRQPPPMGLDRKVAIMIHVLAGLAHAHKAGIIHRDIKPANIFIATDGAVKIMDFGVARLTSASMTGTGSIVGTADYMSPEQVKGAKVDGRSDVFSVGCMLYELITGRRPFRAENLMAIFYRITHEEPDYTTIPEGPEYAALLPFLKKALSKNLDNRFQSAYEFATQLKEYLEANATSESAQHAIDELVDIERPPTGGPVSPDTDRATVVDAEEVEGTIDLSAAGEAPTVMGEAATVLGTGSPTVQGRATPGTVARRRGVRTKPPVVRAPRPAPTTVPSSGNPVLYTVVGGMAVMLLGAGGFIYWQQNRPEPSPPPTTIVAATTVPTTLAPTPEPIPTPEPPKPTLSPSGRAARQLRAANAALDKNDYDAAIKQAQAALKIDPGSAGAKDILQRSQKGAQARVKFQAAETALARKDFAAARAEANAGQQLAPWDSKGTTILQKIQTAEANDKRTADKQAEEAKAKQVNALLASAAGALGTRKYDEAIALYSQALQLDPSNAAAVTGRTGAVTAKAVADATAGTGVATSGGGKRFVVGSTVAKAGGSAASGGLPAGFGADPDVVVKAATQKAALPGKLDFDVNPKQVKSGDKYTVTIKMRNEGNAPIQIKDMIVTTIRNGRKSQGAVPPQTRDVAPHQTATLLTLPGNFWEADTTDWSMQIFVRTSRGETYQNKVDWK